MQRRNDDLSTEGNVSRDPDLLARQLAEQEGFSRLLQDTADILVLTQDAEGRILTINRYGRWLCGVTEDEIRGQHFSRLLGRPPSELDRRLAEVLASSRHSYRHETPLRRRGGEETMLFSWWHTAWHVSGENPRLVSIGLDISDQRIAEEHISWLSNHDPLTGLINRRRFIEEGRRWLASPSSASEGFAVMLLDLDQFRDVNDLHGHHQGDRLLQQVARALRNELRQSDIIARLGGDEFGILFNSTSPSAVEQAATRCCEALRGMEVRQGRTRLPVTTSIGITLYPKHGDSMEQLLSNADIALYEAKASGRNSWYLFDGATPYRERIHERAYWEQQLQRTLDSDTVELHFQPIMELASGTISHYEALLRARDEQGQVLPPPSLIETAERNGMIHRLDEKVVEQVMQHAARLERDGNRVCLAMNLSGLSFQNPSLVQHVQEGLSRHGVPPERLVFEITETAALADVGNAIDTMQALRELGCRFALDDFGVGFSSLYYLKKLPIDFVKLDGSFVRNLDEDPEHQVLIRALVDVARAFQLQIVAEFVENEAVLTLLRELGVHYGQGYHIDRPMPFDRIA